MYTMCTVLHYWSHRFNWTGPIQNRVILVDPCPCPPRCARQTGQCLPIHVFVSLELHQTWPSSSLSCLVCSHCVRRRQRVKETMVPVMGRKLTVFSAVMRDSPSVENLLCPDVGKSNEQYLDGRGSPSIELERNRDHVTDVECPQEPLHCRVPRVSESFRISAHPMSTGEHYETPTSEIEPSEPHSTIATTLAHGVPQLVHGEAGFIMASPHAIRRSASASPTPPVPRSVRTEALGGRAARHPPGPSASTSSLPRHPHGPSASGSSLPRQQSGGRRAGPTHTHARTRSRTHGSTHGHTHTHTAVDGPELGSPRQHFREAGAGRDEGEGEGEGGGGDGARSRGKTGPTGGVRGSASVSASASVSGSVGAGSATEGQASAAGLTLEAVDLCYAVRRGWAALGPNMYCRDGSEA